ncbi:hypothetical protein FE76_14845, partial [Staphylococcus aureus]
GGLRGIGGNLFDAALQVLERRDRVGDARVGVRQVFEVGQEVLLLRRGQHGRECRLRHSISP